MTAKSSMAVPSGVLGETPQSHMQPETAYESSLPDRIKRLSRTREGWLLTWVWRVWSWRRRAPVHEAWLV